MDINLESFPVRNKFQTEDWNEIQNHCGNLSQWGINVLRKGLDDSLKTVIIEENYICKDHRNLFSNYYSKKFQTTNAYCERLHFFSEDGITKDDILFDPDGVQECYLGYSVIRPVAERCLGRTIIDPNKITCGNILDLYCLTTTFQVNISGVNLKVKGYPYTSQDSEVTVCAHSSLWGVCRYLSERYTAYAEAHPYDLVLFTNDIGGRKAPYRGMTYSDYSTILTKFGCHPVVMRVGKNNIEDFQEVYTYVESGFPVLASIGGHVISLIGHTLDYSKKEVPDKNGIIESSQFLKHFVVVDDNIFPYQLFGYKKDSQNYGIMYKDKPKSIESIAAAVCPLPEKAFLPADRAALEAKKHLLAELVEIKKYTKEPIVTRLFMTSSSSFKKKKLTESLKSLSLGGDNYDRLSFLVTNFSLPHFIWVLEVSTLDSYKKGVCFAEFIFDATANSKEKTRIYLRIANKIWYDESVIEEINSTTEFEQYTHNLGEK